MASLQQKTVKGRKYWYIVESRRVNGKPRPVVLEYLGSADRLLGRLSGPINTLRLKSYQHGDVSALLDMARQVDIVSILNKYIQSNRKNDSSKPLRNGLTAGATFLLAAIGRSCRMTSKRGWYQWAKTTSLEYLLKGDLSKLDSQHFWDQMDVLPIENIAKAEEEILLKILDKFEIKTDSLFYDTTNFYTFISTTNNKNTIAQRGKNKQKRNDLRQVGLVLVVSQQDQIPLFHHSYTGNINDSAVFKNVIGQVVKRMIALKLDLARHTVVLDRGNNSKTNLEIIEKSELYYVGALTPTNHKELTTKSLQKLKGKALGEDVSNYHMVKTEVWGKERTLVFFLSDNLREGQLRGMDTKLTKVERQLEQLQQKLSNPKSNKRNRKQLTRQITRILEEKKCNNLITWELKWKSKGRYELQFERNEAQINEAGKNYGLRILMTNRHEWAAVQIIQAYYGQANVEKAFKELKNPYHLTIRPQYHWTDQKIRVHYFICVIAYLLSALLLRQVKKKGSFKRGINALLNELANIRLVSVLGKKPRDGLIEPRFQLEEMTPSEKALFKALNLEKIHHKKVKIKGVSVYK